MKITYNIQHSFKASLQQVIVENRGRRPICPCLEHLDSMIKTTNKKKKEIKKKTTNCSMLMIEQKFLQSLALSLY